MMTDVERLLAIEEIKQLKARYFRFVDTREWVGLAELFLPDANLYFPDDVKDGANIGRDMIVGGIQRIMRGATSMHHGHTPEIEIISPTEARGIWAMMDIITWEADDPSPLRLIQGHGYYHDEYRKVDGHWRFHKVTLRRLRVIVEQ